MSLQLTVAKSTPVAQVQAPSIQLFRAEAVDAQRGSWLGTILLEPKPSHRVLSVVGTAAAFGVLLLLFFGSFTRTERVNGWLVPTKGIVRIVATQGGIVESILVKEGQQVTRGTPLVTVSGDIRSAEVGATAQAVIDQLHRRRDTLAQQRALRPGVFDAQQKDLAAQQAALQGEVETLGQEIRLQKRRLSLSADAVARARILRERGFATKSSLAQAEGDHFDQAARVEALERSQSERQREAAAVSATLRDLPFNREVALGDIDREIADIDGQIAEAAARRGSVITAPQDGTVTGIQTEVGSAVTPNIPMLTLLPASSQLQAQLFAQGRAIGFIEEGNSVRLRYQAFPFQTFGFYAGTVDTLSRTAISPAELPAQLSGLSEFYGSSVPVYRITVDLANQDVTVSGRHMPLQAGMQVEADILVETHRLIEWMLYPLFARTGAWSGS